MFDPSRNTILSLVYAGILLSIEEYWVFSKPDGFTTNSLKRQHGDVSKQWFIINNASFLGLKRK